MGYLEEYYTNFDEDGRLEHKHGQIEFLITMRYVEKYLQLHYVATDMISRFCVKVSKI